jgi:hypothetical protein
MRTMVIFYMMLFPGHICSLVANSRLTTRTPVRKRKNDPPMDILKPRTALLQMGENDVVTSKATTTAYMDALNAANIISENSGSQEMERKRI